MEEGEKMAEYQEKAIDLFYEGYNCSQATFLAFEEILECNKSEMAKIASSFGGGMGHMGEVCGALTGAFMAVGSKLGYDDPKNKELKNKHYALIQEIAKRFKEEKGSILCRELLVINEDSPVAASRKPGKACEHLVAFAAGLVEDVLIENKIIEKGK